jgi:glycyl-tRNA synthetase beta chain
MDALLEIGTESLPSRFLKPALAQMEKLAETLLSENRLAFEGVETVGTPMRQTLLIRGLAGKSEAVSELVTGPPARLLKDADGNFTKQAAGFAKKNGVAPEDLTVVEVPKKGEFLQAKKEIPSEAASDILRRVFPALIAALEFPKGLVWEASRFRFGRPIRTLCALYGKKTVPFELAGVKSTNKVRGLSATGAKAIKIESPERYVDQLRDDCVVVDLQARREALGKTLAKAMEGSRGVLDGDLDLLEQTVCLTEHPVAVLGSFKEEYLELPPALLTTVLKKQLMFFPVLDRDGRLLNEFVGVRDGISEGQNEVRAGFEKVIDARFSDARFFSKRDRETTLAKKTEPLARVTFQNGLGNMAQKTQRNTELARAIFLALLQDYELDKDALETIAGLAFADLQTDVVGEFPELQGTMGGVYARAEGLGEKVAMGLEEFYYPIAAKSPVPTTMEGCIVSLAHKLDTVASFLAAGFKPSGSEDPFALRRLGNGAIRIVLEKQLAVSIPELLDKALELAAANGAEKPFDADAAKKDCLEFLWQRVETMFLEKGFKIDELRAVEEGGLLSLVRTFQRLAAVHALRPEPDFVPLAAAFKRASNILKQAKMSVGSNGDAPDIDPDLLSDQAEKDLFRAVCQVESEVRAKVDEGLYEEGLRSLVALKPQVDKFFDDVMVMAEDEKVKDNRLRLLARMVRLFKTVADISHIQN